MQGTLCRKQPRDSLQCSASAVQQRTNITCNAQVAEGMSCPLLGLESIPEGQSHKRAGFWVHAARTFPEMTGGAMGQ